MRPLTCDMCGESITDDEPVTVEYAGTVFAAFHNDDPCLSEARTNGWD